MFPAWFFFSLALLLQTNGEVKTYQVTPAGCDFRKGEHSAYLSAIHQIESSGAQLVFRGSQDEFILTTDLTGKVMNKLGGLGGHPSEFASGGVLAIAVNRNLVAALDKGLDWVRVYQDGAMRNYFKPSSYNARGAHNTSNAFGLSDHTVILPTTEPGFLAKAIHLKDGKETLFGDALDVPLPKEFNEEGNATLWAHAPGFWFAVHKFFPLMTLFDDELRTLHQFPIEHPKAQEYIHYLGDFESGDQFTRPQPLITDMKVFGDHVFLMVQGELFQFEKLTGTLLSTTRFMAEGETFAEIQGHPLYLPLFAFAADGTLFLAHPALLWGHDFWRVDLPFLKPGSRS